MFLSIHVCSLDAMMMLRCSCTSLSYSKRLSPFSFFALLPLFAFLSLSLFNSSLVSLHLCLSMLDSLVSNLKVWNVFTCKLHKRRACRYFFVDGCFVLVPELNPYTPRKHHLTRFEHESPRVQLISLVNPWQLQRIGYMDDFQRCWVCTTLTFWYLAALCDRALIVDIVWIKHRPLLRLFQHFFLILNRRARWLCFFLLLLLQLLFHVCSSFSSFSLRTACPNYAMTLSVNRACCSILLNSRSIRTT
mmetsp:Transcript_25456/g.45230  ORF Transcript_25456/g.45230 Transcript_25456/m.45230 type:complete len:247 (-) Transcript_25456:131-871(-)